MANAWCINAIWYNWCFLQTLQQLDSACIWVWVQYTAPDPLDDKRFDYITYTDKCWCSCCISWENEILIYATQWTLKNLTLTNDDTNEVVNVKRTDLFWSNWKKTVVRYKTWSFPTSVTDWTLAVEELVQNQYQSSWYNVSWLEDWTQYYFTAFALDIYDNVIDLKSASITTEFWYVANANTLFFIKNNWEISDHSQYNHTMNRYWTSKFYELSNWRKVAHFDWTNGVFSDVFSEANWKTNFTLHVWRRHLSFDWTDPYVAGWLWRKQISWTNTDRRWMHIHEEYNEQKTNIMYWMNSQDWWHPSSSFYTPLPTDSLQLYTVTVNWWTFKMYIDWQLRTTYSWTSIRWWSSTWPRFSIWKLFYPDWTLRVWWPLCYIWQVILEDKTETDSEVLDFYLKTAKQYWDFNNYQEVEYIQSSWSNQDWQYISTWLYWWNVNEVEMEFSFPSLPPSMVVNLLWTRENSTAVSPIRVDEQSKMIPRFWSEVQTWVTLSANTKYKVRTTYSSWNQKVYVDDVLKWSWAITYSYANSHNITIFWLSDNWYIWNRGAFKLYSCKLKYNWNLLRDFVPCYRKSDSVIWLFDKVAWKFYTNVWTWTFTKWPDVN